MDVSTGGQLKCQDFLKKFSSELVTMLSSTPSATSSATSTKPATHAVQDPCMSPQPEHPKMSSSLVGQKSVSVVILWIFFSVRRLKVIPVGLSESIPIDCP